ncbi:MAG: AAA family ATPase [Anaerolineales bacterium]|nr:AAA family ATPase [Anaerolineales bacterium]
MYLHPRIDLLCTGLAILAGRPKLGESWLAVQLATAVGSGHALLGLPSTPGRVLYPALKDTPRRLRDRLIKQQAPAQAAVSFVTQWETLGARGWWI